MVEADAGGGGDAPRLLCQLRSEAGEATGAQLDLPTSVTPAQLQTVCNALLEKEATTPYSFFVDGTAEITSTLGEALAAETLQGCERVLDIVYQPQAVFRVRAVTRCTSTVEGHAEAVISAQFSPDGRYLASGSGDTTVRFWDVQTETPQFTCEEHKHWVLCIAWSPDGARLASACKNGMICVWEPATGRQVGRALTGHRQWVTALAWRPLHLDGEARRLASSSKDATVRVWDVVLGTCLLVLSGHTQCVTGVKWGGSDLLYSTSQDRGVKVWRAEDGVLCRTLTGHAHWVNSMALSTDYVLRTGAFDPASATVNPHKPTGSAEERRETAARRYKAVTGGEGERLVTGSDDFTLFLWTPETEKKPVQRMTGHQQLINQVVFSPDARLLASASFDKSVKLWCGKSGRFLATLRGHVQRVHQVAWAADSRLLVSASADSTLKVWDVATRALHGDLPGHADEVYAVDWSPDGQRVVSGGKDKVLKLWRR